MVGVEEKKEKVFRFSRADFGPLDCVPLHYDLDFDFPLDSTGIFSFSSRDNTTRVDLFQIMIHFFTPFFLSFLKDVKVTSRQTYMNKTSSPCSSITLDAHDLKVLFFFFFSFFLSFLPSTSSLQLEAMEFALAPTPLGEPPIGLEAKVPDFIAHVKVIWWWLLCVVKDLIKSR